MREASVGSRDGDGAREDNGANAILNSPLATWLLSTMSDRWTGSHLLALRRNL